MGERPSIGEFYEGLLMLRRLLTRLYGLPGYPSTQSPIVEVGVSVTPLGVIRKGDRSL